MLGKALDGRYLIESKLAAGGFGSIYRARSLETSQVFAIKLLQAQHTSDPSVSARFRREAVAMSSLANHHTVTTFELGEDRDGTRFIVMELLDGESLAERFAATGPLPWRTVLGIVRATCESLAEAHGLGIVHRDLKPANIFLCKTPHPDFVKVLDFGIAKILHGSNMHDGADLTRIGQAIGTLEYMSPEQLIGGELDNRTDIYTLGVVAYEMIAGHRPFNDVTGATGLVTALMTRKPPPPSTVVPGHGPLPAELDGVLLRCLEREAQDRYGDVRELVHAIDRMLDSTIDSNSTQRQWGRGSVVDPRPLFEDDTDAEDEVTWIDSTPPFELPPRSVSAPRFIAGETVSPATRAGETVSPNFESAARAQFTPSSAAAVRAQIAEQQPGSEALAPRTWRAQGTGGLAGMTFQPQFDFTDTGEMAFDERTGARPLFATRYEIGTEATANVAIPRLAVGSSPVIEERPAGTGTVVADPDLMEAVVMLPPAPARRLGGLKLAVWAIVLSAAGLGLGIAIASLAT
jgi:serine/threonine protein kinase